MSKRQIENTSDSDSDSDDVLGPSLQPSVTKDAKGPTTKRKKRTVVIDDYNLFNEYYNYSYKNESRITSLAKTPDDTLIVTGFRNGMVKFWQKDQQDVKSSVVQKDNEDEDDRYGQLKCVKQFLAHPDCEVRQLLVNQDGLKLVSVGENDATLKVFDLKSLDMIQVLNTDFIPNTRTSESNCWFYTNNEEKLLVNDQDSNKMVVMTEEEIEMIDSPHKHPIHCMSFNSKYQCFLSSDIRGILEYWSPSTRTLPDGISFQYKSETDLFELVKSKSKPSSICFSEDQQMFATISYPDNFIRLFNFKTGKLIKKLDESHVSTVKMNPSSFDFEKYANSRNILFDKNDKVLIYPSLQGIKILNLQTNKLLKVIGTIDQDSSFLQFNQLRLFKRLNVEKFSLDMISSNNSIIQSQLIRRPLIISSSINSNCLYIFGNKKNSRNSSPKTEYSKVVLHTTLGDIKISLFEKLTPKTVENFVKLCQKKYYNNVIFHRVIENFMIQTGDPLGDGTGGDSIWGGHFKDEFNHLLNHSKPFMVSMANAGPNTNGSQFFITTEPAQFLDNKHTIFGEVIEGFDTVKSIEKVQTDESDKPLDQVAILSTSLS
ncbi:uncharacterized protein CANTADRAFT_69014 [Suhomyces tanzawaensis NRRL Y-17324]|uniref:peptidylprolyl isomerase n=1 Tax=Suhomyces tanzawaensis NRRL Y-17324 TaxID=984487 RepID=A0A1E4SEM4_9ASCO|nr:uncharacterized protein CANTADRAFT_69014 [Suhomyces tanzawaensis NRRL Y-17324]ODV77842.1 hypothetical protein CANTADRAFT_69014 [Suhomyces tanzawaensis NRRL Y-17324]